MTEYRAYTIEHVGYRGTEFVFAHEDHDPTPYEMDSDGRGDCGDPRSGSGRSIDDCKDQIDEIEGALVTGSPKQPPTQDEVNDYLDRLRESGVINMYGASALIQEDYGVTLREAHRYLTVWMKTFGLRR